MIRFAVAVCALVAGCLTGLIAGMDPAGNGAELAFAFCVVVFLVAAWPIVGRTYRITRTPPQ